MTHSKRVVSSILTAAYGAFAGGILGYLLTFWMWGLGFLLTAPAGLLLGAFLGWNLPLRDSVPLLALCIGAMACVRWLSTALGGAQLPELLGLLLAVLLPGPLVWVARLFLSPSSRLNLAIGSLALLLFNIVMFSFVRT